MSESELIVARDGVRETDALVVTYVVVANNRHEQLEACLRSLVAQPERSFEVLVILTGAVPALGVSVEKWLSKDSRVRKIECAAMTPGAARNLAWTSARAPLLYFVDDDTVVPPENFAIVRLVMERYPDAAIVGGPNLTATDEPWFARLTGGMLGSLWGTGITRARYAPEASRPATERDLISCNLVVKKEVFAKGLRFPERIFGGEETVLLGAARRRGYTLWYAPELWVYHYRRGTLRSFLAQIFRYGRGRGVALVLEPRTFHLAYLAPPGLALYLLLLPKLLQISVWCGLPLLVYATGTLWAAFDVAVKIVGLRFLPALVALFPLTHLVYAAGLLASAFGQIVHAVGLRR